ncbi:OsmC family protein [Sciscionella sediminilitoris]|uniref:OsmC family protein n=1 Tax=Sciscionella sediminilitoris TaxID=1445613 RepID=UPI0004DF87B4|nr:OsmC family protein [Sciscionella sp. SE31]
MTTTDSAPNGIDSAALEQTIAAVRERPELGQVTFTLGADWPGGCRQQGSTGELRQAGEPVADRTARYRFTSDEPEALLGTDQAASPAEYILQALAGCYAVTFAATATARGIRLSALRLDLEADFDLRAFLGIDRQARAGAREIRVTVHAESPDSSREQLAELTEAVQRRSPIRDTLAGPVQVSTVLA